MIMSSGLKCRKGRINNTRIVRGVFIKTAVRVEHSKRLRLKREQWSLSIAKERGVSVPKVIDYYLDRKGREVLKLEVIRARTLTAFPIESQIEIMRKVGSEMLKLRSVSKKFGWPDLSTLEGEFDEWRLFLYKFTERYSGRLVRRHILQKDFVTYLLKRISSFDFGINESDLIHRDIKLGNILCTEGLTGYWIVDWENSLLGDQLFDLAVYSANYGQDRLWEGLVEGFGSPALESDKYKLYEKIALIGTIDFYRKRGLDYSQKAKKLLRI